MYRYKYIEIHRCMYVAWMIWWLWWVHLNDEQHASIAYNAGRKEVQNVVLMAATKLRNKSATVRQYEWNENKSAFNLGPLTSSRTLT
jgi:hypothetical protein